MRRVLAAFVLLLISAEGAFAALSGEDGGVQARIDQPAGQTASSAGGQSPAQPTDPLPVSIERIRKGLATEPTLKLEPPVRDDIPRFYLEVSGTPDFRRFLAGFDLQNGPVPGAAPTHADIMRLVTPKELYSQAGFGGLEVLTANLSFAAIMYLAQKAFVALANAKSEREVRQIREEIQRELAELEKAKAAEKGGGSRPPGPP